MYICLNIVTLFSMNAVTRPVANDWTKKNKRVVDLVKTDAACKVLIVLATVAANETSNGIERNRRVHLPGGNQSSFDDLMHSAQQGVSSIRRSLKRRKTTNNKRGPTRTKVCVSYYLLPEASEIPRLTRSDPLIETYHRANYGRDHIQINFISDKSLLCNVGRHKRAQEGTITHILFSIFCY